MDCSHDSPGIFPIKNYDIDAMVDAQLLGMKQEDLKKGLVVRRQLIKYWFRNIWLHLLLPFSARTSEEIKDLHTKRTILRFHLHRNPRSKPHVN